VGCPSTSRERVVAPGVNGYQRAPRVADAIAAAGRVTGQRVDAARAASELNLAALIRDGDRIVVPARGDPLAAGGGGASVARAGRRRAGRPQHGDRQRARRAARDRSQTAQKILDARAEKPFASVDELRVRKIVGAATFEKLRALVTVR
jgi:competence protein ComEA